MVDENKLWKKKNANRTKFKLAIVHDWEISTSVCFTTASLSRVKIMERHQAAWYACLILLVRCTIATYSKSKWVQSASKEAASSKRSC